MNKAIEVAGTKEIKTWLMGFGSLANILRPAFSVKEIREDLKKSLKWLRQAVRTQPPGSELCYRKPNESNSLFLSFVAYESC
jgi:hypothetical protein